MDDENLLEIVREFTAIHEGIYFEVGILTGVQLLKVLEQRYKMYEQNNMYDILQKCSNSYAESEREKKKALFESFIENRIDTALEEAIKQNNKYQQITKDAEQKIQEISFSVLV